MDESLLVADESVDFECVKKIINLQENIELDISNSIPLILGADSHS